MAGYIRNQLDHQPGMRKKITFKKFIIRRFFIRFHMSIILIGTVFSGVIFSKILLFAGVEKITLRYPLVTILSYGCFFILIRVWLLYIKYREKIIENAVDATTDAVSGGNPSRDLTKTFECGDGRFGGGGVSGSFEDAGFSSSTDSSPLTDAAGEAGGSLLEEAGVVIIPLMLLLAAIFGAGILLIYQAPVILSEAAFEFVLAGSLLKKTQQMDSPDWAGSVLKNTWKPFLFTLLLVIIAAWLKLHFYGN